MRDEWKDEAERLFFISKKSMVEIAAELSISRQTVSNHLKICADFADEKERRKKTNAENRKQYQRDWDSSNRRNSFSVCVEGDSLRREHEEAVKTLSYERFFTEYQD